MHELNAHLEAVQEIYERVIHAQRPIYYSLPPAVAPQIEAPEVVEPTSSNLIRFLDERAPALAQAVVSDAIAARRGSVRAFSRKADARFQIARAAQLEIRRLRALRSTSSSTALISPSNWCGFRS